MSRLQAANAAWLKLATLSLAQDGDQDGDYGRIDAAEDSYISAKAALTPSELLLHMRLIDALRRKG